MALHWTFRWLGMLLLFAFTTFGVSAYAGAAEPEEDTKPSSSDVADPVEESADTTRAARLDRDVDENARPEPRTPEYMLTITRGAFFGAILGGLVGGSIYMLSGRQLTPWVIGYSAAGGVFFGTLVGTLEVATRESRARPARQRDEAAIFDDSPRERAGQIRPKGGSLPILHLEF